MADKSDSSYHKPVLAEPVVSLLVMDPDGTYVDGTVGGGGHSRLILEKLGERGRLIGCDRDADAIARSRSVLPTSVVLIQCRFSEIRAKVEAVTAERISGILLDLGVSSHQLDEASRGFSHRFSGPLDLRMDQSHGETAAELIARSDPAELTQIIFAYGEEPQARRIVKALVRQRAVQPVETTEDLTRIIDRSVPATRAKSLARVFQALRIAVNRELEELDAALTDTWELLRPGGRLVILTYHSLEDRPVKNFMKSKAEPQPSGATWPFPSDDTPEGRLLVRKPVTPDENEIAVNPRARSAKLRAIEKIL